MLICRRCLKPFSPTIKIDGVWHNSSKRKFCYKCSPFGSRNTRDLTHIGINEKLKLCAVCKEIKPFKDFYSRGGKRNNKPFSYCISCERKRQVMKIKDFKNRCLEYKQVSGCERCGYNKSLAAIDFHHRDPTLKDLAINQLSKMADWEKTKKELDKCTALCANCHREVHENGAGCEH